MNTEDITEFANFSKNEEVIIISKGNEEEVEGANYFLFLLPQSYKLQAL